MTHSEKILEFCVELVLMKPQQKHKRIWHGYISEQKLQQKIIELKEVLSSG